MQRIRLRSITSLLAAGITATALGTVAAPAAATSLQTQAGVPYAGALNTALVAPPGVHVDTAQGDIDCNQSPITAAITNAGSSGGSAAGNISALDFTNNSMQACPDTIGLATHLNFVSQPPFPWSLGFDWLSDASGTTGATRNGTVTLSGVVILVDLDVADCTYRADFNNTGGTTNQVQADFFNPNNTASGNTEMKLDLEPFELQSGDPGCSLVPTSQLSATYNLTGTGGAKLQLRAGPPAPPASPSGAVAGKKAKKCKKKKAKKRAGAAKKKCKKKRR